MERGVSIVCTAVLAEMSLCHACSCHEISRVETAPQVNGRTVRSFTFELALAEIKKATRPLHLTMVWTAFSFLPPAAAAAAAAAVPGSIGGPFVTAPQHSAASSGTGAGTRGAGSEGVAVAAGGGGGGGGGGGECFLRVHWVAVPKVVRARRVNRRRRPARAEAPGWRWADRLI
eukprot:COSAG01_NODE_24_length_37608_cov_19.303154_42_plen_174_part_00